MTMFPLPSPTCSSRSSSLESFGVFVGKMDTLDADLNEFASGRGTAQFMNANFVFNSALALRLPYSTLGGGFAWLPSQNVTISGSIVNTADSSTTTGFEDFGAGTTITGEASFKYTLGQLPGGQNIGGIYSFDQDFTQLGGRLDLQTRRRSRDPDRKRHLGGLLERLAIPLRRGPQRCADRPHQRRA